MTAAVRGFQFDEAGFMYNLRPDGKEYPTPMEARRRGKPRAQKWEVTNRANGKVNATITLTLSGDTLSSMAIIPQSDGKDIVQTSTSKPISEGSGFF